jgi:hypothetical protein
LRRPPSARGDDHGEQQHVRGAERPQPPLVAPVDGCDERGDRITERLIAVVARLPNQRARDLLDRLGVARSIRVQRVVRHCPWFEKIVQNGARPDKSVLLPGQRSGGDRTGEWGLPEPFFSSSMQGHWNATPQQMP